MKYLNLLIILTFVLCNLSLAYEELQPSYYLTEGDLYNMRFSPDGSYLAAVLSTGLSLYHYDSGELITQVQARPPGQIEISSDGRTIVGLFDKNLIKVWSFDGLELETQATIETETDLIGQPVRSFELGKTSAGAHIDKNKSVYWDGRNENGEEVSSGIYFYTVQTGDFRQSKKMVIVR